MAKAETRYLFIDTETTGLDPNRHGLVQVAMLVLEEDEEDNRELARLNIFFKSDEWRDIDLKALQINRIQVRDYLSKSPHDDRDFDNQEAITLISDFLTKYINRDTLVIGHNINFDLEFIESALDKFRIKIDKLITSNQLIDTLSIANFLHDSGVIDLSDGKSLDKLEAALGLTSPESSPFHDAMEDVVRLKRVYEALVGIV